MKSKKHDDRLKNVPVDSEEKPEIYAVKTDDITKGMSRREFVAKSIIIPISLGAIASVGSSGCSKGDDDQHSDYESVHIMSHADSITSLAFNRDGKKLNSASYDLTIKIWSLPDGAFIKAIEGLSGSLLSIPNNPNWEILAWAKIENTINLWSVPEGEMVQTLSGCSDKVYSVVISPDGKTLASGEGDSTIKFWNLSDGALFKTLEAHTQYVHKLAISPDGKILASTGGDKKINLYSLPDILLIKTIEPPTDIRTIAFSPDGGMLASVSGDIHIWSVPEGSLLKTLTPENPWPNLIMFSPNLNILVSAGGDVDNYPNPMSFDKTIKIWNLSDGSMLHQLSGHKDIVDDIAIRQDGTMLASGSADKTVRLWALPSGIEIELPICYCDTACTCDTVSNIDPNLCNCNSIETCTCYEVCSCDSVCSCDGDSAHYWYPS